jgi:hypothetical protein
MRFSLYSEERPGHEKVVTLAVEFPDAAHWTVVVGTMGSDSTCRWTESYSKGESPRIRTTVNRASFCFAPFRYGSRFDTIARLSRFDIVGVFYTPAIAVSADTP